MRYAWMMFLLTGCQTIETIPASDLVPYAEALVSVLKWIRDNEAIWRGL
jgi:hypothetical protein